MWIVKSTRMRSLILGLLVLTLTLIVAGCGGSSETTTTVAAATTTTAGGTETTAAGSSTSVTLTGDAATIAANWTKFFDGSQPVADKAALLENGSQFSKELETQGANPLAKAAAAKVTDVKVTSATAADVTWDLLVSGTPALPGQKGQAVLQDGTWKVSAASFQALLALQGGGTATTVPAP